MAWYHLEIFVKVDFDDLLTYEELIEIEEELKVFLQEHFIILGAEHLEFFTVAEGIQIQFVLREDLILPIRKACRGIQKVLKEHVRVKLMVVNRDLTEVYTCSINTHELKEKLFKPFSS